MRDPLNERDRSMLLNELRRGYRDDSLEACLRALMRNQSFADLSFNSQAPQQRNSPTSTSATEAPSAVNKGAEA